MCECVGIDALPNYCLGSWARGGIAVVANGVVRLTPVLDHTGGRQEPLRLVLLEARILPKKVETSAGLASDWNMLTKWTQAADFGPVFVQNEWSSLGVGFGRSCFVDVHWPDCRVELQPMEWISFVENMNVDLVASATIWAQRQRKAWIIHQSVRSVFNCTRSLCTSTTFWSLRVFPEDYTSHLWI